VAFDGIRDQQRAVRFVRALLRSGRLPHASIFLGSQGTGRLALARELARVLLCGEAEEPDQYCGRCRDCRLLEAERHPDYQELARPSGRQLFPIEAVHDLQAVAALKPVRAGRRVFVVRDADRMSMEAANCFLKTLEEPPGGCLFVLIAASLRDVPETIVSRCRLVRFANLPPHALAGRLRGAGLEEEDAEWLARRAWGSPGLADQLAAAGLHGSNRELVRKLGGLRLEQNFALSDWLSAEARRAAAESEMSPRIALEELLECALLYYRDAALAAERPEPILERADLVLEAIERIGANANRRLALDDLFTRLALLEAAPG
jgi:DNA polymerase-3 subunit delta'